MSLVVSIQLFLSGDLLTGAAFKSQVVVRANAFHRFWYAGLCDKFQQKVEIFSSQLTEIAIHAGDNHDSKDRIRVCLTKTAKRCGGIGVESSLFF